MRRALLCLLLAACASSSTTTVTSTDAGPADCPGMAADLCKRAVACGSDGKARVALSGGPSTIAYDSEAFCTKVFTDQCGPDTPESDVPRVTDPSACAAVLTSATCRGGALAVPSACGGKG